ncbi:MAG TPA: acyl-CoA dehydrogenase family protein [Afipia sp.]
MLDLNDDERALKEGVESFADGELRPHIKSFVDAHEFPEKLVAQFGALGFMGTAYEPDFDGGGLGARGSAIVAEALSVAEPGFAAIYLCNSAPMTVISRYGSQELKREWLAPLCRGEVIASFGVTETHGGSDVASIKTRAVDDGNCWVLNGSKVFSTNAGTPLHGLSTVVAVTDPDKGPKGLSTFVVPVGTEGFRVGKAGHKTGWRIAPSVELFFEDCRIPKRFLVGERGDGLKQILTTLSLGRILVAAASLGLSRKAFNLAREYGRGRKVGGRQVFDNQGLTFPLADAMTQMHAAELMIRNAACLADDGKPFRLESSMAKLFASEMAGRIADTAVQVHGGYGMFEEYEVSGLLGEAKVLQIVEGTSEVQRLLIARELAASN